MSNACNIVHCVAGIKAANLTKDNVPPCVGCPVCSRGITFNYRDVLFLAQFMTPEGGLFSKRTTGIFILNFMFLC